MKLAYRILLCVLCVVAALTFFPWIYDLIFPAETSEPFVAWSPVCDSFVISETGETNAIYTVDSAGIKVADGITKSQRDSLLPQTYFNQLMAKNSLPDSIAGKAIDVPTLKHTQWVFNSLPRDINKSDAGVYPIMESRPKRVDLEDPTEAFTLDGEIRFIEMATNNENADRSRRFSRVFTDRGFAYPAICTNADINTKKPYDEGYLLIDSNNKLYHMKMQAGQPYLASINMPEGATPAHAFILENPDMALIGLIVTSEGSVYAIEKEGYTAVKLPLSDIRPTDQRITIMKNLFNWVVRVSDNQGTQWTAIDSDTYDILGTYSTVKTDTKAKTAARWIFPFRISFTSLNDCYAYPRISDFSLPATLIWILIISVIIIIKKSRK